MEDIQLIHGDCLEKMKDIQSESVHCIITDPPYGTTACKWDSVIPFEPMWKQLKRIIKPNGAICFFGSQPFTSMIVSSNPKMFKYEWIWQKNRGSNFALLKYQPFKEHENILVFSKCSHNYYPIMEERSKNGKARCCYDFNNKVTSKVINSQTFYNQDGGRRSLNKNLRNPSSVQKFNTEVGFHPTQKPILLLEYLLKTYTVEHETVLDFTMGSGSTGVACVNTNRKFIGIELDKTYFDIAENRIKEAINIKRTSLF